MCKNLFKLLLVTYILIPNILIAQGVEFKSNDNLISNRTSYNVFEYNQPKFTNAFSFEFSLSINNPLSFGYIFSIKNKDSDNSYSLSYINTNTSDNSGQIKFNLDAVKNIFTIPIKAEFLGSKEWIDIKLIFNSKENSILLLVNNERHLYQECMFKNSIVPEIYFGKHESVIEVPSMSIKSLKLKNGEKDYTFNFNESQGEDVFDAKGKRYGKITHANWLISDSYHWKPRYSFSSKKVTSVTFDEKQQRFIFVNADSLQLYNFRKEEITKKGFKNELPVTMRLGLSTLDSNSNKLYIYEVNDVPDGKATVANLNLDSLYWNVNSTEQLPTQRHHHNSLFDEEKNELIVFGGFGNQRLTNSFNRFNFNTNTWNLQTFEGDTITPRYFSGLGKINKNEILLFGGLGNKTGDQSIGKIYYYDCYKVNLLTKKIKKLWDTKRENTKMVSSRDMVLAKDSTAFYTLSYPEYIASTHLQLYKYNIKNGDYEVLGDSIPMISERIRTNANLYFNKDTEELFSVVLQFEPDGSNKINIYSINAPPVSKSVIHKPTNITSVSKGFVFILLLIFILLILFTVYLLKRKKEKKKIILDQVEIIKKFSFDEKLLVKESNSVSIFGNFTVIDKNGKDISYLFSPKIRQLFLYLFFNSKDEERTGVTSEQLHTTLWPDSIPQKAKNLKNVTLNQLRNVLRELNGIEVIYSFGHFFIEFGDTFYCDYFDFNEQLKLVKQDSLDINSLTKLVQITRSGKFLKSINDECFDKTKKNFEFEIVELIPGQLKRFYKERNYTSVIGLTDILFNIDPINEIAFYYKLHAFNKMGMLDKAKKHFNKFILNYKRLMGDDFPHTFNEVLKKRAKGFNKN